MKKAADLARILRTKSANDLTAARIGLDHDAPLDTVCFHVQQAVEKLIKAALAAKEVEYPFTHELRDLIELALPHYPMLRGFVDTVPEYTEYAVRLRYDDVPWVTKDEAVAAFQEARRLSDVLSPLLP